MESDICYVTVTDSQGVKKTTSSPYTDSFWNSGTFYFKLGDYVQLSGTSSTDGGKVAFYAFNVQHGAVVPAIPSISPASGTYVAPLSVSISDSTSGATIYYTTNGTTPTTSSTVYTGPISIPVGSTTIKTNAVNGSGTSPVATASYTVTSSQTGPLPPGLSPAPGTYLSPQSVTITDGTSGATIYYTTNGSTPTTSSAVYSSPVSLPLGGTTLRAIAANASGSSTVTGGSYIITSASAVAATSGGAWQNQAMTSQAGTFTAVFDATPSAAPAGASPPLPLLLGAETSSCPFSSLMTFSSPFCAASRQRLAKGASCGLITRAICAVMATKSAVAALLQDVK